MTKRDVAPIGAPCWIDLLSSDPDRSRAFYGELLGWTSEDLGEEYGGYIIFSKDGIPVAGGMRCQDARDGFVRATGLAPEDVAWMTDGWSIYLAVEDADATAEAAVANGGAVLLPAMDIPEVGRTGVVTDVGGASIGTWQPGPNQGFGTYAEPGTAGWFELHTRDYDKTVQFYRDVFKWDIHVASDEPDFRYTTLGVGEGQLAGIMDASGFLPDGVPAHWSIYFQVDDTDAALKQTEAMGGSIVQAAEDTPYGRLAAATDPTGAAFKLVSG
jgi:uncharacterized protein